MKIKLSRVSTIALNTVLAIGVGSVAMAEPNPSCFMLDNEGNTVDLSGLCGESSAINSDQETENTSTTETPESPGVTNYRPGSQETIDEPPSPNEEMEEQDFGQQLRRLRLRPRVAETQE